MKLRYLLMLCACVLSAHKAFTQGPLEFVENKGQWGAWLKYKVATPAGDVCLEKDGFRYILEDGDNHYKADYYHHGQTTVKPTLKFHVYKVTFEGANIPITSGERPEKVYYNYFLGNDSSHWRSGIHPFRAVNYNKLYNGVDMHVSSEKGNIDYEFIVHPKADPSQIRLRFDGQNGLKIRNHNLVVTTSVGDVSEMKPYAYQYINNERVEVPCEYSMEGNTITYEFPSGYDHSQQLIIDPIVLLCTLTGSKADNWGFTATYDEAGNFYAGGLVNTLEYGGSFPVSPGAFQITFGGGNTYVDPTTMELWAYAADISIIKYDPTLATRIYATYLGGSGNDHVHSMIVDASGNLTIAGRSISTNFPVTPGAYQPTNHGWWDIVVTKFNATGTALIGSTYIGGSESDGVNFDSTEYGYGQLKYNYGDDARSEIQIDKTGNIYVASCTNSPNFPTTPTAISSTLGGLQDGVVFKFNSTLTSLLWSTYIGGSGSDAGYVLAFDTAQTSVYVGGGTNSPNFPVTAGSLHSTYQGGLADGFVLKFNSNAPYNLQKGTYVGTSGYDQVYGLQVSSTNQLYAMGQTLGGTFPVTAGVYSNAGSSQFVIEMDNNLATDIASTVFGSGNPTFTNISPVAFLIDTCDNVYISGWGGSLGIPGVASGECNGMPLTPDAAQSTTDGRDFYFIVLGAGLTSLRYATYYGRFCTTIWEGEHVDGGTSRFNKQGIISQAICANCGGIPPATGACPALFPTTAGVWDEVDSSRNCNEAALKIAFNIGPVTANASAGPSTSGCAPLTVNFTNTSTNGVNFVWTFGDGSASVTTFSTSHTFTAAGIYTVSLAATNTNACFRTGDTAYLIIVVDTSYITPAFTYTVTSSCNPYTVAFTNSSITHVTGDTTSYMWYFGDGTSYAGMNPPSHNYPDTGTYTIMYIMANLGACKSPDTIMETLSIHSFAVSANFNSPDTVCQGTPVTALFTGSNATSTAWNFGDGYATTGTNAHVYDSTGTFTITVVAKNSAACNGIDTFVRSITVLGIPIADFVYAPTVPIANVPTSFTNQSKNAIRYLWDFGDDSTSTEVNPVHQYNMTGEYKVCLTAYAADNCPAQACKTVPTDVEPIIGIPSAFTPNGDGDNDILYVRGAAIKTLDLKIFNRWGQLVFETTSKEKGWDGSFNGQPQPIDAYAYVLKATFIDGTGKTMKGNITLLR